MFLPSQGDDFKINVVNYLHDTTMDTSTSLVRVSEIYLHVWL